MRRHSQTPSLGTIAEAAGVSRAAVSMALRNHPRIPVSTRERIQKIANELGWRPNPLLAEAMSAIRAGQPTTDRITLAWVTSDHRRDGWRVGPFMGRCWEGAEERAERAGYRLEHFWLGDVGGNATRLSEILYNRGINGVIIAPLYEPGTLAMQWPRFAAATIAYTLTEPRLHRANDNHSAAARVCVARLHAAGRRRIGLALAARLDHRVADQWTGGYLLETFAEGIGNDALLHRPYDLDPKSFLAWVELAQPDAIISTEPRILEWLAEAKINVPTDIAYCSLDLAKDDGAVAGIYQDAHGIGAAAVDLVAGQLLRHERGLPQKPKTTVIDGRWIDGATAPVVPEGLDHALLRKTAHLLVNTGPFGTTHPVAYD
ncbi:LacI family DNA-binding transcriptional regulator [Actomonas aquatica]|uniref:LacI family DNA-binding transcriptional regulator n=1 Tax=Actomonas aquatica TaxID=2866162 RepID=A0ABZ1C613_9BACT|nr:LacI family DNA-binding transcriptional regulator [Opitutus sp. WL0086]WRQ87085.1 LacI family DNA-binding transcriptional regulator [Opitutus sp. WL0086]